ncbi:unnamed protein product [Ranitomeya imitator]|uniref:VWFD domain-containing protein n=1 Tax=Ranitomeya imitator TaxID=111125 RepID=A0ABN9KW50_9NEOB|nr:unnamed protein product [Ranitomeya imitator]
MEMVYTFLRCPQPIAMKPQSLVINKICIFTEKTCKNNQVLQYSYGSCFRTCFLSSSNEQCDKQQGLVAEICGCPDGQYLNIDETCVTKSECDCFHVSDVISAHQKIEIDGRQCECVDGKIDCRSNISEFTELCSRNAEFVDCSFPNNQRPIDLDCSTKNLPIISDDDECKPGCYCRFGMVRDSKGNCVPFTDCPCLYGGEEYASGSSVNISCNQCVCTKGTWKCSFDDCQTTCSVFGNGHFKTFDGMWYTYDGVCPYTLAQCTEHESDPDETMVPSPERYSTLHSDTEDGAHDIEEEGLNGYIARLISLEMMPYRLVESEAFKALMAYAVPRYDLPSRHFFVRKAIPALHQHVKEHIVHALRQSKRNFVHRALSHEHSIGSCQSCTRGVPLWNS